MVVIDPENGSYLGGREGAWKEKVRVGASGLPMVRARREGGRASRLPPQPTSLPLVEESQGPGAARTALSGSRGC